MIELGAALVGALPGVAALAAGLIRWRAWRGPGRAWRVTPPLARIALFSLAALALAACHTTHRGHYAQTPVPLTLVPFQEPLRYSVGPNAGQTVPAQNGLLATYFAGALYDRLDHQQIDPNVEFQWDATNQNPVVSGPESLDFDECGFCGLPSSWGIWSIVWEGYLEAPVDGDYVLDIHVNNGGWLEMKDPATGSLVTVISAPGGPGFEGDAAATRTLAKGRHYIRMSYYQNGPTTANAFLKWQVPGAADLAVLPSSSLFTQVETAQVRLPLIFVPGFGGSQLVATNSRTKTLHTSDGGAKQVSYSRGDLIWLDLGRAVQAVLDPEFFDVLRFNDDGTPSAPRDFEPNGEIVALAGAYPEVEQTLREAGYVRDRTYFLFTYDFRYGAEAWTQRLDDLVVRALAANPGATGVDIVAHSMGTLVTRAYLTTGPHAGDVHAAVLMGGPLLGTPKGNYAATAGTCLTKIRDAICVLREQTAQYIIRTLPGGLELGASTDYYSFFQGADRAHPVAYLDRTLAAGSKAGRSDYALLHDAELALGAGPIALAQAERFHSDDLTWLRSHSGGVSLIAGSGSCTIGQVVAYSKPTYRYRLVPLTVPPYFRLATEFAGYVTAFDTTEIDGDGTVVRQSAALSDPSVGLAANGAAATYYRPLAHDLLAAAANLRDTALPLVRGEAVSTGAVRAPECTQVSTHSPVELLVSDDSGRRVGRSARDQAGFTEIPGGSYDRYLDMSDVALNVPGRYTASLTGTGDGDATIRVRWVRGAGVSRMAIFAHVPVTARSRGSFTIDDASRSASTLTMDLNGDGSAVLTVAPVVLDGPAAEDSVPPELTILAPKDGQAVVGWFGVSWMATDAGSGIGATGAAVDLSTNGPTLIAPGPIALTPGQHQIDVFAEDRAGNLAAGQRTLTAYSDEWLEPVLTKTGETPIFNAGRTIPVRFGVRRTDGTPVVDNTVTVDIADAVGNSVVAPVSMGPTPAGGVVVQNGVYHADVRTAGLAPGTYIIRARFESPLLTGELRSTITLR